MLSVLSKVDCRILFSLEFIRNFKISDLTMVKVKKVNIAVYLLPVRLQEILVPLATANTMAPHAVPKQKSKQKHSLVLAIYILPTRGVKFTTCQTSKFKNCKNI
jgi:hypothetical protein